jgi:serine/threonine protein kinase
MVKQSKKLLRHNSKNSKPTKRKARPKYEITPLKFLKRDMIGEGVYSKVYKFRYSEKKIDPRYVVKKLKIKALRSYLGKGANNSILELFRNEIRAIIYLSKHNISPKVFGIHADIENDNLFYVLEKLDVTIGGLLRDGSFKLKFIDYFIDLLRKMIKTPYRHTDLHIENVMYHKKRKQFYLIDFGHYKKLTKEDSAGFFYTDRSSGKDFLLFDKKKGYGRAVMGTSGYSALSMVYKYLVYEYLNENKEAKKYYKKLVDFIKSTSSHRDYTQVLVELNRGIGITDEEALALKI